jgi:hypothetical protein
MSESITSLPDAVAEYGAFPVPAGSEPQALSAERLAEITARTGAATEGPWRVVEGHEIHQGAEFGDFAVFVAQTDPACGCVQSAADAEFIAHARTDVPELLTDNARLRARVAELEAERQATNEWVDDAAKALRANRDRIAELERPAVERHRVGVRDSYRQLAAQARTDGDYEGEAVVLQQLAEREAVWAREDELAREFAADPLAMKPYVPGSSVGASVEKLTRLLALREPEGEHYAAVHHSYRLGHDLPETGGTQC